MNTISSPSSTPLSPAAFFAKAQSEGLTLYVDGATLRVRGPESVRRKPGVIAYLKRHKAALVELLTTGATAGSEADASEGVPFVSCLTDAEALALRTLAEEGQTEAAMIAAAEKGVFPLLSRPLLLPSGRCLVDLNRGICLLLAAWRKAVNDHFPWELYPDTDSGGDGENRENSRTCEAVAAEMAADLDAIRLWWEEAAPKESLPAIWLRNQIATKPPVSTGMTSSL